MADMTRTFRPRHASSAKDPRAVPSDRPSAPRVAVPFHVAIAALRCPASRPSGHHSADRVRRPPTPDVPFLRCRGAIHSLRCGRARIVTYRVLSDPTPKDNARRAVFGWLTGKERHVIVAQGTKQHWQGHPHTVLLPDGRTMYCVWQGRQDGTRRHGAPGGLLKRSASLLQ